MDHWFMLTLVGEDRPGIVAEVSTTLFDAGCNLGEASMIRLGGNFTIMLMVQYTGDAGSLTHVLQPVADALQLRLHVDAIEGHLHQHAEPDVRITVYGADRAGIVAQVTGSLAEAGLHITDLESSVGGNEAKPIYIMYIEGQASKGIEVLQSALSAMKKDGIEVDIEAIDTLIG